jgi:hypothetical protein
MIAKISTGVYTLGMVKYNHDKTIADKTGEVEGVLLGTNLINKNDLETIVSTIRDYNNLNTDVLKSNIHISLNFHKDDILDNNTIYKIAQDYLEEMGYKDQPYAIYRHFDREHPHVHIVSSQINTERKKINDSHIYYRSQALTRKLEEKYSITKAVEKNEIFSKKDIHKAINEHLEEGKHSLTAIMKRVLSDVLNAKPTTIKQFEKLLDDHQMKRIISIDSDDSIKGHSFYLLPIDQLRNENFETSSKGITAVDLDNIFTYQSIETQIDINIKQKEFLHKGIMGKLYAVINPLKEKHRISLIEDEGKNIFKEKLSDFITSLRRKGIEVVIKRTQTGDDINSIYGLLFKDIKSSIVYSATEMKIKTKDFLMIIDDDLKNISEHDKKIIDDNTNETMIDNSYYGPIDNDNISFFSMFSEILKNNNTAGVPDDIPLKNRRKRKKGL